MIKKTILISITVLIKLFSFSASAETAMAIDPSGNKLKNCPGWLNHSLKQLHSSNTINICDNYNGKAILIVNTASHCGFTHQFSGLEALHQKFKNKGLRVVGFSSNDFNQEAKSEEKVASICYENFGVTFTMIAPSSVKGKQANPVFQTLSKKSREPSWNFNKFLISADGKTVTRFGSGVAPDSNKLISAIETAL